MLLRGGHPACERRVAFFLPYYMDEEDFQEEEQFRALQVTAASASRATGTISAPS